MLYKLFYYLHDYYSPFNVFRYITFRTALAIITSLFITFATAPWIIRKLRTFSMTQYVRNDGPQTHLKKEGPEYERYNEIPMFRYNTYFGINTVHYLDLIETSASRELPMPQIVLSAVLTTANTSSRPE